MLTVAIIHRKFCLVNVFFGKNKYFFKFLKNIFPGAIIYMSSERRSATPTLYYIKQGAFL